MRVKELIEKLLEFDMSYQVEARIGEEGEDRALLDIERVNEDGRPHIVIGVEASDGPDTCLNEVVEVLEKHGMIQKA